MMNGSGIAVDSSSRIRGGLLILAADQCSWLSYSRRINRHKYLLRLLYPAAKDIYFYPFLFVAFCLDDGFTVVMAFKAITYERGNTV